MMWVATVAAITPASTGHRARGPNTIRIPEEIPAAGQNTGHAFRFQNETDAKGCRQEIAHADYSREPNAPNPLPSQIVKGKMMAVAINS